MGIFAKRRQNVLGLASKFDTVVVTNPKNLFYLTDFWGGGVGIVEEDATTIVTSVMEEYRANETGKDVQVVPARNLAGVYHTVTKKLNGRALLDQYDARLKGTVDEALFLEARRKKDADEVKRISQASRKVEELYELLETEVQVGRTELEVAAELMRLATATGLSPLAAEGSLSPIIIASGPNGALPHAELSERKIRTGDMIVADIFFRYQGYCTDCTRTFAVGKVPEEWHEGYRAVLDAQMEGVRLAKKGAEAKEVHAGVSAVLKERHLDRYFTHGTGHGVGIDIHERPSIGATSTDVLTEGDVITIEPGIYIPGKYGVRIEDSLLVGSDTKNFFEYTKELLEL